MTKISVGRLQVRRMLVRPAILPKTWYLLFSLKHITTLYWTLPHGSKMAVGAPTFTPSYYVFQQSKNIIFWRLLQKRGTFSLKDYLLASHWPFWGEVPITKPITVARKWNALLKPNTETPNTRVGPTQKAQLRPGKMSINPRQNHGSVGRWGKIYGWGKK